MSASITVDIKLVCPVGGNDDSEQNMLHTLVRMAATKAERALRQEIVDIMGLEPYRDFDVCLVT